VRQNNDSDPPARSLAERVRRERESRGLSRQQLEQLAGLSTGYISRLESGERGKKSITNRTVQRIAQALEVSPGYLTTGTDVPDPGRHIPVLGRPLESVPGYRDAEFAVARLEPDIPVEFFQQARQTRFPVAPERVSVPYLRALVRFLASADGFEESDQIRTTEDRKKSRR